MSDPRAYCAKGWREHASGSAMLHPEWRGRGLVSWAGLRAIARHGTTARRLYWLMDTDRWRAYALVAGNTRNCWPRDAAGAPSPLYDRVCKRGYGDDWDAERRACRPISQRRLRPEVALIPPAARASNRRARAYAALNPGHVDGDALPVLVPRLVRARNSTMTGGASVTASRSVSATA